MGQNTNSKAFAFRLPLNYAQDLERIAQERGQKISPLLAPLIMKRIDQIKEEEQWNQTGQ